MRVAIFGGTFDPIHNAHLAVARRAADTFALDRVLFIPAAQPPHKPGLPHASYADRLHMVQLACRLESRFEASALEEGTAQSYSIHTIGKVRETLDPSDRLFFLIGADAFAEITSWFRWEDVRDAVEFIVVSRPGFEIPVPPGFVIHKLETVSLDVSSSAIRRTVAAGILNVPVPPEVLDYIRARRLYRPEDVPR